MAHLYDVLISQMKAKQIEKCELEIEYFNNEIKSIRDDNYDDLSEINIIDRKLIIDNMQNDLPKHIFTDCMKDIIGLFANVDNIRYVYAESNRECPNWIVKKYGHLFKH